MERQLNQVIAGNATFSAFFSGAPARQRLALPFQFERVIDGRARRVEPVR
jgi:hypothetical protein